DLSAVFSFLASFCSVCLASLETCWVYLDSVLLFSVSFEPQTANNKLKVNAAKPNITFFNVISPFSECVFSILIGRLSIIIILYPVLSS
ncbi:hypothetical protein ACX8WC_20730, partial [Bacillus atrophaeus]